MSDPDSPTHQPRPPPPSWRTYCQPDHHQHFVDRVLHIRDWNYCRFGLAGQWLELAPSEDYSDDGQKVLHALCKHKFPEREIPPWDMDQCHRSFLSALLLMAQGKDEGADPV